MNALISCIVSSVCLTMGCMCSSPLLWILCECTDHWYLFYHFVVISLRGYTNKVLEEAELTLFLTPRDQWLGIYTVQGIYWYTRSMLLCVDTSVQIIWRLISFGGKAELKGMKSCCVLGQEPRSTAQHFYYSTTSEVSVLWGTFNLYLWNN